MRILLLLICCALLVTAAAAQDGAEEMPPPHQTYYAPYIYMGGYPSPMLAPTSEATGIRHFSLAFILNGVHECHARWMGSMPLDYFILMRDLQELRELGGDIIVSFGGWGGVELAMACPDVESLTAEYQRVIDTLGATYLDFDIEGDKIRDLVSIERRSQAIAALQAAAEAEGRPLVVAFTLPVRTTGLTEEGLAVLESAIEHGVRVDVVNVMTMNFGAGAPPDRMGENTIAAAESVYAQLQALYPEKEDHELWGMIGLTPMIGMNDAFPETFTLEDAELVTAFAQERQIRLLAMWSMGRDRECPGGTQAIMATCSGIVQEEGAFATIFNRFAQPADE